MEENNMTKTTEEKKDKIPLKERAMEMAKKAKTKVTDAAKKVWEKRGWIGTGLLTAAVIWLKGYLSGWKDSDMAKETRVDDRIDALCRLGQTAGINGDDLEAVDDTIDIVHEWGADHVKKVMNDPRFEDSLVDHLDD